MGQQRGDRQAVSRGLYLTWVVGALLLALVPVPAIGPWCAYASAVVLAAAAGTTISQEYLPLGWNLLALAVPASPVVIGLGIFAWLASVGADPMGVVVLLLIGGAVCLLVWTVFVVAVATGLVRRRLARRRRFGEPRPAWENAETPPPYS
jgi:hypothetical protein